MAYASASDVAALTKNLVAGGSTFTTATSPNLAQVNAWLTAGCSMIETVAGGTAISATAALYGIAVEANAIYAAWMAERSRTTAATTAQERTRADMLRRDFQDHLLWLEKYAMSRGGATPVSLAYAGGISKTDKETVEADDDRVTPRFRRGWAHNPEALTPDDTSAS